ncbi:accessory gene regulator B [Clostridium cavendishii DSM 21758]|uniref:Accessory gene regulator B n=1 Tax=Clostridium cavendishii DSM 21758 TaxID=1121302 RepID=A0A1M6J508_9CLOT|nr:accessory gene regulator B family protein [Clostridium cavendishii]SHJ41814.1 accessory gene regulator B [Clostridium cavendishii DSM 21758]
MILKIVRKITDFIAKANNITDEYKIDRIRYGIEVIVKEGIKFTSLLLISILFHKVPEFIIITALIVGIRRRIGGGHCKGFVSCFVKTSIFYISIFLISSNISRINIIGQVVISLITIYVLLTVKYKTKLVAEGNRNQNFKIKLKVILIYILVLAITVQSNNDSYINTTLLTSLYIIYEYIKKEGVVIKMRLLGCKKRLTNHLMTLALIVGAASLNVKCEIWWEEIELPLDVREDK